MKNTHYITVAVAALFISSTAWAGTLTIPNTFTAGSPAVAADVNANFTAGKTAVDDNNTRITANTASAATNATNITALQNSKAGFAAVNMGANRNAVVAVTTTEASIASLTMNAPAAGFAIITAQVGINIAHTLNTVDLVHIKISKTTGSITGQSFGERAAKIMSKQPTDTYWMEVSTTVVIPVVAGANLFHLNARSFIGAGAQDAYAREMVAIYVPHAY